MNSASSTPALASHEQPKKMMKTQLQDNGIFILKGIVFPLLLAVMIGIGNQAATRADIHLRSLGLWLQIFILAIFFILAFSCVDYVLSHRIEFTSNLQEVLRGCAKKLRFSQCLTLDYEQGIKAYWTDLLKIWSCWVIYIILLFPGVVWWDTGDQLAQMYGIPAFGQAAGQLFDHHPFFVAYLFAGIIKPVQYVTGSLKLGVFVVVLFQTVGAAAVFTYGLRLAHSYGASERALRVSSRIIKYFPLIPILYCSLIKDSIHSIFFVWWVILFIQLVITHQESLKSPRYVTAFFFAGLLSALTKKTGAYIIAVCVLFLLFQKAKISRKIVTLLCGIIPSAIVIAILPAVAYAPLHIVKGGPQAPLAVPIEMMARVAHTHPEAASKKQREVVSSFLIYDWSQIGKRYDPYITDPVTHWTVRDAHQAKAFLQTWAEIGIKHPRQYVKAFVTLESGWISFVSGNQVPAQPQVIRVKTATVANESTFGKIANPVWDNPVNNMVLNGVTLLTQIPIVSVLFIMCLWTACIPVYLLYWLWTRKVGSIAWFAFLPYFISVVSLVIYPVSQALNGNPTRYIFHTVVLVPIMISMLAAIVTGNRTPSDHLAAD